jgi:hypothetical protein
MLLAFYFPHEEYSYEKLDKVTHHHPQRWTWQGAGLIWLAQKGFEVVNIENLDYEKFAAQGEVYLKKLWSKEVFETQKAHSELKQEQYIAQQLIQNPSITLLNQTAFITDVENYFNNGYVVLVGINTCVVEEKECYTGHLVVTTDITDKTVTYHDPGLPPIQNKIVPRETFKKAMEPPGREDTNIIAVRM